MPLSMSQVSLPAFLRGFDVLSTLLDKAEQHAEAKKIDVAVLMQARLSLDMMPFVRQVQTICDGPKLALARLSGIEAPSFPDTETSFAELRDRVAKTRDFVGSIKPESLEGAETRAISLKAGPRTLDFAGQDYLLAFVLPNFYFHVTTAYAILRHNGVPLGKIDYLGALPLR